jgi:hypothetical protein
MPRICSICTHAQRALIDQAIITGTVSLRGIARQFGVGTDAIERHRRNHLMKLLGAATRRRESESDNLLDRIEQSHSRAEMLFETAASVLDRVRQDPAMTLKAVNSCVTVLEATRKWTELLAELTGALKAQNASQTIVEIRHIHVPLPEWSKASRSAIDTTPPQLPPPADESNN